MTDTIPSGTLETIQYKLGDEPVLSCEIQLADEAPEEVQQAIDAVKDATGHQASNVFGVQMGNGCTVHFSEHLVDSPDCEPPLDPNNPDGPAMHNPTHENFYQTSATKRTIVFHHTDGSVSLGMGQVTVSLNNDPCLDIQQFGVLDGTVFPPGKDQGKDNPDDDDTPTAIDSPDLDAGNPEDSVGMPNDAGDTQVAKDALAEEAPPDIPEALTLSPNTTLFSVRISEDGGIETVYVRQNEQVLALKRGDLETLTAGMRADIDRDTGEVSLQDFNSDQPTSAPETEASANQQAEVAQCSLHDIIHGKVPASLESLLVLLIPIIFTILNTKYRIFRPR